ncbi:MAG TPA: regulatory iron-sulfur-containing complex subunit RicT [Dissulfurispiraceae bacterium]|nr:regulatory iron-sulfur-containing complex subunit RicT [Dissulfurispiraceae bacterium]
MPDVVGIRFRPCSKIYDFEVDGIEVKPGDSVVVESEFGLGIGTVVKGRRQIESPDQELKKIIRVVTEDDWKAKEENKKLEEEARVFCLERIMARGLPMKLVGAESTLDRRRIVFYFSADGRIDFRELVKDLAARFRTRIEMRQIGVRDEAKTLGGFGICGRELCCKTFLTSFEPISIKMAKKQDLVLNVGKLSGLCGRLMCCLRYEYDGDLETIASDDEIPLGVEDAPVEVLEEKISKTPKRPERRRRGPRPAGPPGTATALPGELPPEAAPPRPAGKPDQQEAAHKPSRGKRRRYRK